MLFSWLRRRRRQKLLASPYPPEWLEYLREYVPLYATLNDDVVLEVPLTLGAVTGGVVALAAPGLMVLGALAGLLARVKIEVVRNEEPRETLKRRDPEEIDL